jgi:quercetin dioxygenase-like cupin family protein
MRKLSLKDMVRGWFVGDFFPTAHATDSCEVGIKRYAQGDYEAAHHHKLATEITVIISGEVEINGVKYVADDVIVIEPGESTDFRCLTDVVTCVYKSGSFKGDKHLD